MTSAKNDLREVLAERFGEELVPLEEAQPVDGQATSRARFIATLHAIIAFLQAHPMIPTPWSASIGVNVPDVDQLEAIVAQLRDAGVDVSHKDGDPHAVTFRPLDSREFYTPIGLHVHDDGGPDRE
jgi:hypothetical protein